MGYTASIVGSQCSVVTQTSSVSWETLYIVWPMTVPLQEYWRVASGIQRKAAMISAAWCMWKALEPETTRHAVYTEMGW